MGLGGQQSLSLDLSCEKLHHRRIGCRGWMLKGAPLLKACFEARTGSAFAETAEWRGVTREHVLWDL